MKTCRLTVLAVSVWLAVASLAAATGAAGLNGPGSVDPNGGGEAQPPGLTQEPAVEVLKSITLPGPRANHKAIRLLDGRILLVGGSQAPYDFLARVDIFNPATNELSEVAPLHTARSNPTATLLRDGRVLVVGGYSLPQQWLDDAEVYDPRANTWTVVRPLYSHGLYPASILIQDGRVLVAGGAIGSGVCTNRAEIFDPSRNTWTAAVPLPGERASVGIELLNDGRVLVVGGGTCVAPGIPVAGGDALLYDPRTNVWTATGPMVKPRIFPQTTMLPDGRVLAVGGLPWKNIFSRAVTTSAEIYNPVSNTWTSTGSLSQPRVFFVLETLHTGKGMDDVQVLAVGGSRIYDDGQMTADSFVDQIESYDPASERWSTSPIRLQTGVWAAAALVSDSSLWVSGGGFGLYGPTFLADTWLLSFANQNSCSQCAADISAHVRVQAGGWHRDSRTGRYVQQLTLTNVSSMASPGPVVSLALDHLSSTAALYNPSGTTACTTPTSPFVNLAVGADNVFSPGESVGIILEFTNPTNARISYTPRVLAGPRDR